MIDIHSHILPGIDDGAEDLASAVAMCRQAAEDGCEAIFATPHQRHAVWWNTGEHLASLRRELRAAVGERPQIYSGAEIRVDAELMRDLDRIPESGVTPLADSSYLLLEFPRARATVDPEELVNEVMVAGWRPILAHPELISMFARSLDLMHRLAERGALFQITAMSVTGEFGPRVRRSVRAMLDAELVHFVASDAHGPSWRPPGLSAAREVVAADYGQEVAHRLLVENPSAVVQNRALRPAAAVG